MRVLWLALASLCLSLATADDQPSCGVLPSEQASDCSVAPTLLRVTRAVKDPLTSTSRSTRVVKHKRRARPTKRARVARSTREDYEVNEEHDSPQQRVNPYSQYEDQVPGDWRSFIRQVQASAYLATPRYCPHCRQLLPPESAYLHHSIDPRMFLPIQAPRYQTIPINNPSHFEHHEEFSNANVNNPQPFPSEESCPFNYRMMDGESESQSTVPHFNHTLPNMNKRKEFKKSPAGFSDAYLDSVPSDESSPSPPLTKMEMTSMLKKSKLPTVEELTKYLEKKNNNN